MKKFLLFITSIFTFSFASAASSDDSGQKAGFETNPKDSTTINFYELQKIKLYPNPVSDYLYIDYERYRNTINSSTNCR